MDIEKDAVTVEDKLHWTFRLYDVDGSGEIDPDEMEQASSRRLRDFW